MAKLFEEVLHGSVHSPSADLLIHFSGDRDNNSSVAAQALANANASSPGGPACPNSNRRPVSPRATVALQRSASSPSRAVTSGGSGEAPVHLVPTFIRCHTLVLRTQPSLLEVLLPGYKRHFSARGHSVLEMSTREPEVQPSVKAPRLLGAEVAAGKLKASDTHDEAEDVSAESPEQQGASPAERSPGPERSCTSVMEERQHEVTVDDEPEVFLEMIKFVYLNTCHIDHSNVKAMMHIADKYGIEDIVTHCLQWMQDHFTASLFYHFLTFRLSSKRFSQLLRQSLLLALRSRRHFSVVTEGPDGQWEQLQVSFVEALLQSDELPVVSEAEVLHLLARWAKGALARQETASTSGRTASGQDHCQARANPVQESPISTSEEPKVARRVRSSSASEEELLDNLHRAHSTCESSDLDGSCSGECGGAERANTSSGEGTAAGSEDKEESQLKVDEQTHEDMLRLLRTFRKSDMSVKISDIEPILQILGLNSLFSTKQPRETSALDPGFMIYRGVAGVNVPANFSDLNQVNVNVVPHAWRGGSVCLGSHDFVQQQDGFRPSSVPDGGIIVFPRLWVSIACSSWSHREKRPSKSTAGLSRHSIAGSISSESLSSGSGWETVPPALMSAMPPVNESGCQAPPTLKTMQSQDDWEIGRKLSRPGNAVPYLSDNEKIDHKVVCAVISGHMRHGIRLGQQERSSIYTIEELYGQCEEVNVGGSPTEVEFELQLTVQAPNQCGICQCALAVLPSDRGCEAPPERPAEPLLQVSFDASAEEHLHFYIASCYFDSNSSYKVALNWVLQPGSSDNDWRGSQRAE